MEATMYEVHSLDLILEAQRHAVDVVDWIDHCTIGSLERERERGGGGREAINEQKIRENGEN
jgi:hypothetical protein